MGLKQAAESFSESVACKAGQPLAQASFVAVCIVWLALGGPVNVLTLVLSILAISLTQMVLNRQVSREYRADERDNALHTKIDGIIKGVPDADDKLAGIERGKP